MIILNKEWCDADFCNVENSQVTVRLSYLFILRQPAIRTLVSCNGVFDVVKWMSSWNNHENNHGSGENGRYRSPTNSAPGSTEDPGTFHQRAFCCNRLHPHSSGQPRIGCSDTILALRFRRSARVRARREDRSFKVYARAKAVALDPAILPPPKATPCVEPAMMIPYVSPWKPLHSIPAA